MKQSSATLQVSDTALLSLLKKAGKISAADASLLQKQKRQTKESIQTLAIRQGFITERGITKLHASVVKAGQQIAAPARTTKVSSTHLSGPRMLADILDQAVASRAQAVHIEARPGHTLVRLRVDGLLRPAGNLPSRAMTILLAQVKARAGLAVANHDYTQHGKFETNANDASWIVKAAVLPADGAEKITLRIHPAVFTAQPFKELGYWGQAKTSLQQALTHPRGLMLISGPHSSGLTTTFLNALAQLIRPDATIVTVEDAVSQRITGISQVPTGDAATVHFTERLKAVLRHDPDVIGVDQLHDQSSLTYALQHAAAGRLMLATCTGEGASHVLTRLEMLSAEPYLLATTLKTVLNQRLARRLCDACKQPYRPSPVELRAIMRAHHVKGGGQLAALYRLEKTAALELLPPKTKRSTRLYQPSAEGCKACYHTGYKGFIGINEVLTISPAIQKLILGHATPEVIERQAVREGMVTLRADALIKTLLGLTSIEETLRVI